MLHMVGGVGHDLQDGWHHRASGQARVPLACLVAVAFAAGIALAWHVPALGDRSAMPWLLASAGFLLAALVVRVATMSITLQKSGSAQADQFRASMSRTVTALLCISTMTFGVAWIGIHHYRAHPDDLAAQLGSEAALVRVKGVALASPVVREPAGGALARFDYREPATYFPMRVHALIDSHGAAHASRGEVLVRSEQTLAPFRAGDHVQATGFLMPPQPPRNPGEFDFRRYGRSLGQAGFLTVRHRDLVIVSPAERSSVLESFLDWRDHLRRRAGAWLLSDLPGTDRVQRDSLLASIMLGLRDEHIDEVYSSFQRVGLAHVLAISGFHLGILAAFVLLIVRMLGSGPRAQGLLVLFFVAMYLLMVEARMPVLRAGIMTAMTSVGLIVGRRINISGMLWFSAIVLLLWRPDQLFDAGFQLTYGVVLGLVLFASGVERRLPLRAATGGARSVSMLWHWTRMAMASAITAWVIAMPIVIHHFGLISPLAALLTVITLPLASIILAVGFAKMALAALLPSGALIAGVPLSICADVLLSVVTTFDSMTFTVLHVPVPPLWWTITATGCAVWLLAGDRWIHRIRQRRQSLRLSSSNDAAAANAVSQFPMRRRHFAIWPAKWLSATALAIVLLWPAQPIDGLRIDMLSVGDGSCYIIRSGRSAVLFDAGSSTDLNVARRSIIPAMRRLGVRGIDALIVSHADMDHYSAALEIVDEFEIREAIMTPQLFAEAQTDPQGPVAFMLDALSAKRIVVRAATAGETRTFGLARWMWLHPQAQESYRRSNDDSTVIRIDLGSRSALMCGDIQQQAMSQLLRAAEDHSIALNADVVELPHHGSYHETALQFLRHVNPGVIMQSTGWSRWRQDKWRQALSGKQRLVTARDGACTVHIRSDGSIETQRFVESN